jgi:threonine dehydrogenase-like Zn-dependent dehydrogenase
MKAFFFDGSLAMRTVPDPEPGKNEVLIRILYSAICNTDLEILRGYMGFTGIPGHEFVGIVETPGHRLTGKTVVGEINCACGTCYLCQTGRKSHCPNRTVLGIFNRNGVFADFITLPEGNLHIVPEKTDITADVFTEPLAAAIEIFEKTRIRPSQDVFIFGAGKLGILVSLVFRLHGCRYSTFDVHSDKVTKARRMGLNARLSTDLPAGEKAEVCVDCTGSPEGIAVALEHLYPCGQLVLKTTVAKPGTLDLNQLVINEIVLSGSRCGPFGPAISLLAEKLINPAPLITATFKFHAIHEAFDCARETGTLKVLVDHTN